MYRMHGIPNAFEVDPTLNAARKVGQLVRVKPNGKITTVAGEGNLLFFPLIEDIVPNQTQVAGATISGVAKVYVEASAGIVAGETVGVGATGLGVALHTAGFRLGIALATPEGNGDYIPVLLTPVSGDSIY